jgi:hypothetical protein
MSKYEHVEYAHKQMNDHINDIYKFDKQFKNKCSKKALEKHFNNDMFGDINDEVLESIFKSQPDELPAVERIIVIGDIHGDLKMAHELLKVGRLIDDNGNWTGGNTVVVQVGDQVDRCRYSGIPCNEKAATANDEGNDWAIIKYFTKLNYQASKKGGAVYSLLGNHELMNVNGDFRYVSYEGINEFSKSGQYYKDSKEPIVSNSNHARRNAFEPGNPIADFLGCTRKVALKIGTNLFAHAGVLPSVAEKYSIKSINEIMSLYLWKIIKSKNDFEEILSTHDHSPLWNRVYGNIGVNKYKTDGINDDNECDEHLSPLDTIYKVDKIYVGHTPLLQHGIGSACNDRLWLTDFGASQAFDKFDKYLRSDVREAQVLEIIEKDGKKTTKILKK